MKETRPYIIITTVGHQPRYYSGWNVQLTAEQLTIVCAAINLQERYHHKKVTTHLYEQTEENRYRLAGTFGGLCNTLHQHYTDEELADLEQMINSRRQ